MAFGGMAVPSCAMSACHLIALFYPCLLSTCLCKSGLKLSHPSINPNEMPVHILQHNQEFTKVTYIPPAPAHCGQPPQVAVQVRISGNGAPRHMTTNRPSFINGRVTAFVIWPYNQSGTPTAPLAGHQHFSFWTVNLLKVVKLKAVLSQ